MSLWAQKSEEKKNTGTETRFFNKSFKLKAARRLALLNWKRLQTQ